MVVVIGLEVGARGCSTRPTHLHGLQLQLFFLELDDLAHVLVVEDLLVEAQTNENADDDEQDCRAKNGDGESLF